MTTLIVAAHPDDEVLGCGGTIHRLASLGEVHICILGEGATSRAGSDKSSELVEELARSAARAASVLGASSLSMHGLPDNRFDSVDLLEIVRVIEHRIAEVAPMRVLCQHGGDVNVDHRRTFEAVLAATRPKPLTRVETVCSFFVPSSSEWAFGQLDPPFRPSAFVDISDHLEAKLEALSEYGREIEAYPHPRSPEAVGAWARVTGSTVGVTAAEAFHVVRTSL